MRFKSVVLICFFIISIGMFSGCVDQKSTEETSLEIIGVSGESKEYNLTSIKGLTSIEGASMYQNSFGNWGGKGIYKGIPLSVLADEVGGINEGDILIVTSEDDYVQIFHYNNIYPSTEWEALQGTMILAYNFNGTEVPDWEDGLRIVFLPSDGQYSNDDSKSTSSLELKESSASSKWSKYVKKLEFKREEEKVIFGYNSINYTLSWSQILKLPSINNSGMFIKNFGPPVSISNPSYYIGVNLTYVVDLLMNIDNNFSIKITASDGYSRTFSRDQFFGNVTIYDQTGNEIGKEISNNISLILIYYNGSQKLESEDGFFRSAYVGPNSPITGSKYWIKDVVYIEIEVD